MTEGIFDAQPTIVLGKFHHEFGVRYIPTDTYENLTITAIVQDWIGPSITVGPYNVEVIEARAIAASLLLAADLIDPHHLEQQRRDNADAAYAQYLQDHPDGD